MKRVKSLNIIALGLVIMCISSCTDKNYRMITRLDNNGSASREIYTYGDSAFVAGDMSHNPFLFSIDSAWKLTKIQAVDTAEQLTWKKTFNVKINRDAQSVQKLSEGLQFEPKYRSFVVPEETLTKRFKWFYTYHTYKGTYSNTFAKPPVPIDNYINKEEQKLWFQGDLSGYKGMNGMELKNEMDDIETQFMTWWSRCVYEISFNTILHFEKLSADNPYYSRLESIKDTLFAINSKELDSEKNDFEPLDVCKMLNDFYNTNHFSVLFDKNEDAIKWLCQQESGQWEDLLGISVEYNLIMPGQVLHSNAGLVNQDTLQWKVNFLRFIADDYVITAESRTVNSWAFILTFLLGVFAVYCIAKGIRLKKM